MWDYRGQHRPTFAVEPGPGQESVWDYPRPPRLVPVVDRVRVELGGVVLVDTDRAVRVLETASPPTVYLPVDEVEEGRLVRGSGASLCEWKGRATYWTVQAGNRIEENAAWSYENPLPPFESLRGFFSVYPGRMSGCWIGDREVTPQHGGFYGGWVTPEIVGPYKGEPGTAGW